jgi:hypothetical protein
MTLSLCNRVFPFVAMGGYINKYLGSVRRISRHSSSTMPGSYDAGKLIPQQSAKLSQAEQLICSRQTSHKQQKKGIAEAIPFAEGPLEIIDPRQRCRTSRTAALRQSPR